MNATHNFEHATISFDAALQKIPGLTWLPWIGDRFSGRLPSQRLLIVGESHYFKGDTLEKRTADREEYLKFNHWTREQVSHSHVGGDWTTRTLSNIPRLLFKTTAIDRARMWADAAYYNFVQRPMDYHEGERPRGEDFIVGWEVFLNIVKIIKPSHCLFIGVSAANSFDDSMTRLNVPFNKIKWSQKVGSTWARTASIKIDAVSIELIFVKHLGMYFSWSKWHDYLHSQHSEFMKWLGAENYVNYQACSVGNG